MKKKISSNRSFGVVFFIFFLILAIYSYINGLNINIYFFISSIIFLVLGLLNSKILYPLNLIWYKFGIYLGKITTPILMFLIYFFLVFPTKFFLFIVRKDILNLKMNLNKSYWTKSANTTTNMDNQF